MSVTFAVTPRTGSAAHAKRRGRAQRSLRRNLTGWAFAGPATLVVGGLSIFPAVWAFFISRAKWNGITPATQVGWRNYRQLVVDPDMPPPVTARIVPPVIRRNPSTTSRDHGSSSCAMSSIDIAPLRSLAR